MHAFFALDVFFVILLLGLHCEGSTASDLRKEKPVENESDHIEGDISKFNLSEERVNQIDKIFSSDKLHTKDVSDKANTTDFIISPHLIYRYLNSVNFADNYHGRR